MKCRKFIKETTFMSSVFMAMSGSKQVGSQPQIGVPNLPCLWDLYGNEPMKAKGEFPYVLQLAVGSVEQMKDGWRLTLAEWPSGRMGT